VETCGGSFGKPGERPSGIGVPFTARGAVCGHFVEIHPLEPRPGADVWRLELHDTAGRTISLEPGGSSSTE
jgi:hypothetical protein